MSLQLSCHYHRHYNCCFYYYSLYFNFCFSTIQKSSLLLPKETHITKGELVAQGHISGLRRLRINEDGLLDIFPEASVSSETPSTVDIESLHIFTGGSFHQSLGDISVNKLSINLSQDLVVNAYGILNVSGLVVQAKAIQLHTSSLLTARGRGYGSTDGPGAGVSSLRGGGSGAGHGGTGGRGYATKVGVAYDSVTYPREYGSGGGQRIEDVV